MGCGISKNTKNQYALNTITNSLQNNESQVQINYGHKMEDSKIEFKVFEEKKIRMSSSQFVLAKYQNVEVDYSFVGVLGKGAYGCVKKAKHKILNIFRAIKCIEKKKMNNEENKKLINEVEILKHLDHPHIIKVNESYNNQSFFYIVTEFLSGGELFERIQKSACISEEEAADIMRQILSAVSYCHDRNIVHRDLKPENIMYESKLKDSPLKIIDFGTGRVLQKDSKLTSTLGTIYYIAPEVFTNLYDEKCDVWSCGVILYILMAGKPPFTGNSDEEIKINILFGDLDTYSGDWKYISSGVKSLVRHMLKYDPDERITSFACLNSEWITLKSKTQIKDKKNENLLKNVLINLKNFRYSKALQKAVWVFIVNYFATAEEKSVLQKVFEVFDVDKDGKISKQELQTIYKEKMNLDLTSEDLESIMKHVDLDESGSIDYSEFIMATINRKRLLDEQNLKNTFQIFDKDSDGFLTVMELKTAFSDISVDSDSWSKIVMEVDKNGDGKISLEEFFQLFHRNIESTK